MPLARRTDLGDSNYAGLEVETCHDLQRCLRDTLDGGFDFLVAPLAHPRHRRPAPSARDPSAPQPAPFARSDLLLNSTQWSSQVVGKTSPWIDADSASAPSRRDGEAALRQELMWAAHLSLHAVLLPTPSFSAANYARVVNQFLSALSSTALWVRVPVVAPEAEAAAARGDDETSESTTRRDPFEAWANFRALCEGHPQLGVCLDVGAALPTDEEIDRWVGEPVRAVAIAPSAFVANKRGFPVLPKRHQAFVSLMMRRNVQVILRGGGDTSGDGENEGGDTSGSAGAVDEHTADARSAAGRGATPAETARMATPPRVRKRAPARKARACVPVRRSSPPPSRSCKAGYKPAGAAAASDDGMNSATCNSRRTPRSTSSTSAVLACLADRVWTPAEAGRSPCWQWLTPVVASEARRCAPERARGARVRGGEERAVITLQSLVESKAGATVVMAAIERGRSPSAPRARLRAGLVRGQRASPEWKRARSRGRREHPARAHRASRRSPRRSSGTTPRRAATCAHGEPYVKPRHALVAEPREVFTFEHPNRSINIDNTRYAKLAFARGERAKAATVHGFAGYFDATLYDGPAGTVRCSIYPPTHTIGPGGENMFSWFPIYFPLRAPVDVPAGADVEAHCWRCVGQGKVWYEWPSPRPSSGRCTTSTDAAPSWGCEEDESYL